MKVTEKETELGEFKKQLMETIERQADWREQKAAEYPDDSRNGQSARSLRELERRLAVLPDDHPKLTRLWHLWYGPKRRTDPQIDVTWSEIEIESLRNYGFHEPESGDPEEFLSNQISDLEAVARR